MRKLLTCSVLSVLTIVSIAAVAREDPYKALKTRADDLYRAGSFDEAERTYIEAAKKAKRSTRAFLIRAAGDAAFARGDFAAARSHYALGIAQDFRNDLSLTKGTSGFARAMAIGGVVLGAAADVVTAQNTGTTDPTFTKQALNGFPTFEQSSRPKEFRAEIEGIARDLGTVSKSSSAVDHIPVDPVWGATPGIGIARLLTGESSAPCPAVRVSTGVYLVSSECVAGGGSVPPMPWLLVHGSGVQSRDVCKIEGYTRHGSLSDQLVLSVSADCSYLSTGGWTANYFHAPARAEALKWPGRAATVEFSPDYYGGLVPIARVCEMKSLLDCIDPIQRPAALWGENNSKWTFIGFAYSGGGIDLLELETMDTVVQAKAVVAQRKAARDAERERERREYEVGR